MGNNEKTVLEAWHLIETLAPYNVPIKGEEWTGKNFVDYQARAKINELYLDHSAPEQFFQPLDIKEGSFHYTYYCGCFEQYRLIETLRKLFKSENELINKSMQESYSLSFSIDQNGKYIKGSLVVPLIMYIVSELKRSLEIDYGSIESEYKRCVDALELKAHELFVNGIDATRVLKLQDEYARYFYKFDSRFRTYRELNVTLNKKGTQKEYQKPLPNFFIGDLQYILSKQKLNDALLTYIQSIDTKKRTHIDEDRTYIETMLQPINLPSGRWPSPVEHRLSLMQQVAVNQFFVEAQPVSSVNGPPGTGKTTLLKDLFANIVVKRAMELVKLQHPSELFVEKCDKIYLGKYPFHVAKLNPELRTFSMVVASSNNGAVENISKDLPKKKEVMRDAENTSAFDYQYAEEAAALDYFPDVAGRLIGNNESAWGMFAASLGKSNNLDIFAEQLFDKNEASFVVQLERFANSITIKDWVQAVEEFNELHEEIENKKIKLQEVYEDNGKMPMMKRHLDEVFESLSECESQLEDAERQKELALKQKKLTNEQIAVLPKRSFISRLIKKDERQLRLNEELYSILDSLKTIEVTINKVKDQKRQFMTRMKELEAKIKGTQQRIVSYEAENLIIPDDEYWRDDEAGYAYRQTHAPWLTDSLNYDRGMLFLKAMKLHKIALAFNSKEVSTAARLLRYRRDLNMENDTHREIKKEMWKILHLVTPLFSTTFASFSSMYEGVDQDFIDYLFIDEAGQASPQQATGAIWRSKRVVAVGDPLQIEPVVTTDQTIMSDVRDYFGISEEYLGGSASVQSLADQSNPRGMYTQEDQWMGIPLWVHRRCSDPMFSIANEIAYDNKMVLAGGSKLSDDVNCEWFDCKGVSTNKHFIKEQGELLVKILLKRKKEKGKLPDIYVITPFTAVKSELKKMLKNKGFSQDWIKHRIGTVHTFQGKEADIVYFVVGTDAMSDGAANWSCSKPNLINVAATRAKKEFHVIGDYSRLASKPYYKTIAKYAKLTVPHEV